MGAVDVVGEVGSGWRGSKTCRLSNIMYCNIDSSTNWGVHVGWMWWVKWGVGGEEAKRADYQI